MNPGNDARWCPFRPGVDELETIRKDVAEVRNIQQTILDKNKQVHFLDRVAHQYQVAGSKVLLKVAEVLPAPLENVGLFHPSAEYTGIGRISTGLGTPHIETNPDFLGIMTAFQSPEGRRVDFLGINDPTSPTDNHKDFINVLHATGESAGAEAPFVGDLGSYDAPNLIAEQTAFGLALKDRMGWIKAAKTLSHLTKQTLRTFHSSTKGNPNESITTAPPIKPIGPESRRSAAWPASLRLSRPAMRTAVRNFAPDSAIFQRNGK